VAAAATLIDTLIAGLAQDGRTVFADWRAVILLSRAESAQSAHERRWKHAPATAIDARRVIDRLVRRGVVAPIESVTGIYRIVHPLVRAGSQTEDEVLLELHPYAALGFLSALAFHGMSDVLPKETHLMIPRRRPEHMLPLGTTPEDWECRPMPAGRKVPTLWGRPVLWHSVAGEAFIGFDVYRNAGRAVRAACPERALIDGLRDPPSCGGLPSVLHAWRSNRDVIDSGRIVALVDGLDVGLLRQRVGYVMEACGVAHDALDGWARQSKRGGSAKLDPAAPYASRCSERWSLSLNCEMDMLT